GEPGTGGADDHGGTREPDRDRRTNGDVHGGGGRDGTAWLPVAEEHSEYRRGDSGKLYDGADGDSRQRLDVRGGGNEHGGDGNEQCSDVDGDPGAGGADDHGGTREPDRDRRTNGDVHGGGGRDGTAWLPVAEEHSEYRRGDSGKLYDGADGDSRQRLDVRGGGNEHGGDGNEQCSDVDGEPGAGGADDHGGTREPDGDRRTNGDVHGGGGRDGPAWLPVAEQHSEYRGGHDDKLYDGGDGDSRQWLDVRGGGNEHGGDGNEQCSDVDGEAGPGGADEHGGGPGPHRGPP